MAVSKRNAELLALLSSYTKLRTKEANVVERIEELAGVPVDDVMFAACYDCCHHGKTALSPAEAADMIEKIERREFVLGRARRLKGNGEKRAR